MDKRRYYSLPWYEWYILACKYYRNNGNLLVPAKYETKAGYKLGKWIERQRMLYHKHSHILTEEKKELLENIGMVWSLESRYAWEIWISLCKRHIEEYGNLNITKQYVYEGVCIGEWLFQQRKKYKKGLLSKEQIQELKQMGVSLKIKDQRSWNEWYAIAEKYYQEKGHLNIKVHQMDEWGNKIGLWLYTQREKYRHKRIPALLEDQIQKLDAIHMKW